MASKPKPAKKAVKKAAGSKGSTAKKKVAAPREERPASKYGGKPITKEDIERAEALNAEVPPTIRLPSETYVKKFLTDTLDALDSEKNDRVKDIRDAHNDAQTKNHMDKKASAIVRGLVKMPDSKLYITMFHMAHYIKATNLWGRALRQGQLDFENAQENLKNHAGEGEVEDKEAAPAAESEAAEAGGSKSGTRKRRMNIVDVPPSPPPESLADAMHRSIQKDEANKNGAALVDALAGSGEADSQTPTGEDPATENAPDINTDEAA